MVSELQYPNLAKRAREIAVRLDVSGLLDKLNEEREAAVIRENFALLGAYYYFVENSGIGHSLSPTESRALVWQKMGCAL